MRSPIVFLLFSAKMGTKIVRVQLSVFTIGNNVWDIKFHLLAKISEFGFLVYITTNSL